MTDETAKKPNLIAMSFGGFNSIAIVLTSISLLRMVTAHEHITLNGIVADVIDWYKKFFHQTFHIAIEWVNALHIHWLNLPQIDPLLIDTIISWLLMASVCARTNAIMMRLLEVFSKQGRILKALTQIVNFILPLSLTVWIAMRTLGGLKDIDKDEFDMATLVRFLFVIVLQIVALCASVGWMLIINANS